MEKYYCFVIQPFNDTFNKRYNDIYGPAIKDAGLKPYRVDKDPSVDVIIEGQCGDNLFYVLRYNGREGLHGGNSQSLKITGSGDMYDYDYFSPWAELERWDDFGCIPISLQYLRRRALKVDIDNCLPSNINRYSLPGFNSIARSTIPFAV